MQTVNILLADILPHVLDLILILAILRLIFMAVTVITLILVNRVWFNSFWLNSYMADRTSPFNTTKINFNEFLTAFSKPFSPNKIPTGD